MKAFGIGALGLVIAVTTLFCACAYTETLDCTALPKVTTTEIITQIEQGGYTAVDFGACELSLGQMAKLMAACPDTAFAWQYKYEGTLITPDTQSLDLGKRRVTDMADLCRLLDAFPTLKHIDMFATNVKCSEIEMLTQRYPDRSFGWSVPVGDHRVRTDATAFSTLHNNKSKQHASSSFEALKYCKNLVAIDLGHNRITDISFLESFPELKILILACNQITDISPLAKLTKLEYVELFHNKITDISALEDCGELLDLNLCFNRISDLSPLYGCQKLERLRLYANGRLTKAQLTDAAQALPCCAVDWTSYSTLGGWREHPRYFTIDRIFNSGVYEPWSEE